jgi:hypothetical protein
MSDFFDGPSHGLKSKKYDSDDQLWSGMGFQDLGQSHSLISENGNCLGEKWVGIESSIMISPTKCGCHPTERPYLESNSALYLNDIHCERAIMYLM